MKGGQSKISPFKMYSNCMICFLLHLLSPFPNLYIHIKSSSILSFPRCHLHLLHLALQSLLLFPALCFLLFAACSLLPTACSLHFANSDCKYACYLDSCCIFLFLSSATGNVMSTYDYEETSGRNIKKKHQIKNLI